MNSSREISGSIEPYCTRRPTTMGRPYSVTRSVATTEPRLASHRGSEYWRLTRWSASFSTVSGSIRATVRANSRLVSTSSAATTQRGGFFASGVPGREHEAGVAGAQVLPARPARLAVPLLDRLGLHADLRQQPGQQRGGDAPLVGLGRRLAQVHPSRRAVPRSWPCRSCHSRMRR